MYRIITIKNERGPNKKYKADFGSHTSKGRVTITKKKEIIVDTINLTPSKDINDIIFEAIFDNKKIKVISSVFNKKGQPMFVIGPLVNEENSLEIAKSRKKDEIANERYKKEISGVIINGVTYDTDKTSFNNLVNVVISYNNDDNHIVEWKTRNGFVSLTVKTLKNIIVYIRNYIQELYKKEKQLDELIDSAISEEEIMDIEWK